MSNLGDIRDIINSHEAEKMREEVIKQMDNMIAHAEDMLKDGANEESNKWNCFRKQI